MINKLLFSGALVFESLSWAMIFREPTLLEGMLYIVLPHAVACILLALALWMFLPMRYKSPVPWAPLFLFSIAFFIPLLGMIGVIFSVFPALYLQRKREEQVWQATGVPGLPFRPLERRHSPMFQDGGLQDVLFLATDPERRLNALLATRRMPSHESVPILKLALRDPADDVRLLAYSMLDQKESGINHRIERLLDRLGKSDDESPEATHVGLARWYWELAYLGLAQGSVLDHILGQARKHAEQSLALQSNPEVHLLAGRIALEQGDLSAARTSFKHAETGGIRFEKIAPFLAEAAFAAGQYEEVPRLLARLPQHALSRPPFADLARYWL
ncbi:tetratricopeptide repeat protein [Halopseudomonas salina]|uniref:Pellicle/biofilm biosynthesis protein PelE n=1 Tax=Halopseudomonas salina TaxID=1323744 RepID=A0ABQ1PX43_9GAMM|nr:HEAT repeat domain-containing protein [Halopseudomonas salina]GGD05851.1 pellicle/biofilm biosynthesis protein PelE [Halopseudomonas salina]